MKDEKKIKATEEAKKEVQPEEEGVQLTDEELSSVSGGNNFNPAEVLGTMTGTSLLT